MAKRMTKTLDQEFKPQAVRLVYSIFLSNTKNIVACV